ncbi:MAG: hypothetical protein L3J88_06610 [Gammaproteobacteria bacterium]|nr:hypothetical protein [Gammaproteobacteria bacterium]MCF6363005.1 hypothetical protein [Gammaproteobacteria bacterium]
MNFSTLLAIPAAVAFISCILFVIFGQVTVRKLRKNPETKRALGIEFASGWDILNVAQALSLPKSVAQRIRRNSMGFEADPDLLYKYTTVFDRVLARVFYTLFALSGFALILLMVLDWIWDFD